MYGVGTRITYSVLGAFFVATGWAFEGREAAVWVAVPVCIGILVLVLTQGRTCFHRLLVYGVLIVDEVSVDLADVLNVLGAQDWDIKAAVPLKDSDTLLLILSRDTSSAATT